MVWSGGRRLNFKLMKVGLFLYFLSISILSFAQSIEDVWQITDLLVKEYAKDSILVYHRYNNRQLLQEIDQVEIKTYVEQLESLNEASSIDNQLEALSIVQNINYEGLQINYEDVLKKLKFFDRKKLGKQFGEKLQKNKGKRPLSFISSPIVAKDGKSALVHCTYVCGKLCGSGGIQYLEKTDEKWQLGIYEMRQMF